MNTKTIVGLGELLWDVLPQGKRLGGAPANFAVMSARLGNHAVIASRIGDDPLGQQALEELGRTPADRSLLQRDSAHPTGTVSVTLKDGQPDYVIDHPAAWDFLQLTPEWQALAARADAVCFGSLAQRDPTSRQTIRDFVAATFPECVRVFDVNLRPPFFSAPVLEESLESATILKLNDAEMPQVLSLLGLTAPESDFAPPALVPLPGVLTSTNPSSTAASTAPSEFHAQLASAEPQAAEDQLLQGARRLLREFPVNLVCVTRGGQGSLLVTREEFDHHPGVPIKVVDTVGAGDAFTAALTHYYLQSAPLRTLNEEGNRWGSWVASQHGAMPESW